MLHTEAIANPPASPADDLAPKRSAREEMEDFFEDVKSGAEPEWEAVVVPAWKGRTVWVRSLDSGERAKLRRDGYRQAKNEQGEAYLQETGKLEPMLIEMTVYVEVGGQKRRLFDTPEKRKLIERQRGGALDELIATALRLSGMTKKAEEEAEADFLEDPENPSPDSDWPETSA